MRGSGKMLLLWLGWLEVIIPRWGLFISLELLVSFFWILEVAVERVCFVLFP